MTLQYPLAPNARAALDSEVTARTIAEARELNKGPVELIADFVRPTPAEREEMQAKADRGIARGFVQVYEDAKGNPVIAVSFWKPSTGKPRPKPTPPPRPPSAPREDHTDDLYFNKPGAKEAAAAKKRKKLPDPNQMDLFGSESPGIAKGLPPTEE